jgi:hypothetical protein
MHTFSKPFSPPEHSPEPEQKAALYKYFPNFVMDFDGLEPRKPGTSGFYYRRHQRNQWLRDNSNRE